MAYQADLAQLQLEQQLGKLVKVDALAAAEEVASLLVADLKATPNSADEFAAVVAKEGATGLKTALRKAMRETRQHMAKRLADLPKLAARNADTFIVAVILAVGVNGDGLSFMGLSAPPSAV